MSDLLSYSLYDTRHIINARGRVYVPGHLIQRCVSRARALYRSHSRYLCARDVPARV